jgi:hypothetical protein
MRHVLPRHRIQTLSASRSYVIVADLTVHLYFDRPYCWSALDYTYRLPCMFNPSWTCPIVTMLHLRLYQPSTDMHCSTPCRYMILSRNALGYQIIIYGFSSITCHFHLSWFGFQQLLQHLCCVTSVCSDPFTFFLFRLILYMLPFSVLDRRSSNFFQPISQQAFVRNCCFAWAYAWPPHARPHLALPARPNQGPSRTTAGGPIHRPDRWVQHTAQPPRSGWLGGPRPIASGEFFFLFFFLLFCLYFCFLKSKSFKRIFWEKLFRKNLNSFLKMNSF